MIEDLQRVAEQQGSPVFRQVYQEHGYYSIYRITSAFGSWTEAANAAGITAGTQPVYSDDELIADIERVAGDLGRAPTRSEYDEHGKFADTTMERRFGSWGNAVEEAGFEKPHPKSRLSHDKLLADLKRVEEATDGPMRSTDYNHKGAHSLTTVANHFGSWSSAMAELAEYDGEPADPPEDDGDDGEVPDSAVSREELLDDIQRVASQVGTGVTSSDYKNLGNYSFTPLYRHFDTWDGALAALRDRRREAE